MVLGFVGCSVLGFLLLVGGLVVRLVTGFGFGFLGGGLLSGFLSL